jgi:hypothetical protein
MTLPTPSSTPLHLPTAPAVTFHAISLGVAIVAGIATFGTASVMLLPPAMFIGWIAYSLGESARAGFANLGSFVLGIAFGMGTATAIQLLTPSLNSLATPVAVAAVVILVLSLRKAAPFNNPLAYFLGLTSFFYSGLAPSTTCFVMLSAAAAIGAGSAAIASLVEARLDRAPLPHQA